MRARILLAAAAGIAAISVGMPASAVTFNLINTGGAEVGTKARFGFDVAANYWSHVLTDNVTVNLEIGFQHLGPNILGSTGSTTGGRLVQDVYANLAADRTSALDDAAVAGLTPLVNTSDPNVKALDAITSGYACDHQPGCLTSRRGIDTSTKIFDNDGSGNNVDLDVNTANLKALGFTTDDSGNDITNLIDGSITFSSDFAFDFHPNDGIADGRYDFVAVAIHEMGHALGFVSGVDTYDLLGYPNSPVYGLPPPNQDLTYADLFYLGAFGDPDIGDYRVLTPLDLYRYSADGLDWSVGTDSFFSLDGTNQLFGDSRFSTGAFNGDGSQASHWIDNQYAPRINPNCSNVVTPPVGIMNPTIGACEAGFVTGLDLAAMDAIGWDVNLDVLHQGARYRVSTADAAHAFTPEPATWAMMILGFGAVGVAMRRRRLAFV